MQHKPDNLFTREQVAKDKDGDYILAEWVDGMPMYRRVGTDDEIYQAAFEEWLGVLSQLWTAYGKPVDPDQMTIYSKNLAGVPLGLLESAILRVVRTHMYNSVPTVAQVWAAVRAELGNPYDIDAAIQAWNECQLETAIYRFEGHLLAEERHAVS